MMYWDGGGWAWMMFMPLLWIALIGLIVWAAVRLAHRPGGGQSEGDRPGPGPRHETPREILDRRYASGEIDSDTYREAREHLADQPPRQR
ncbi:SHOCT domain-containing protein [Kitasatospora sp. KL5]|uniref:SHOCT domain-containing protein n=1 Tax=Kitasatospora sp. KL5 TaxID=3425125 RepID=UPI003D6EF187